MTKSIFVAASVTIALLAAFASFARAANTRGNSPISINGTAKDALGRPIENALVSLEDSAGKTVAHATSGHQGEFQLEAPKNGTYAVVVTKGGFKPTTRIVTVTG